MKKFEAFFTALTISLLVAIPGSFLVCYLAGDVGLEYSIASVAIATLIEIVVTTGCFVRSDAHEQMLWGGTPHSVKERRQFIWGTMFLHVFGFLFFFIMAPSCDVTPFQDFEFMTELGHGEYDYGTSPAYLWWVLAAIPAVRMVIIQSILLLAFRINIRRQS